jgi:hypothetical protein
MNPELLEEWARLSGEARALIVRPPVKQAHKVECHAAIVPSFASPVSYTILSTGIGEEVRFSGMERTWHHKADAAKLEGSVIPLPSGPIFEPTLKLRTIALDSAKVRTVLEKASAVKVPARCATNGSGLDGTSYYLAFGDFFLVSRFEWWEQPPSEWTALAEIFGDIIDIFDTDRLHAG